MVAAHFSFSQIRMEQEEEAGKTPEEARAERNLKCKYLFAWLKASLGNIWPGFRCIVHCPRKKGLENICALLMPLVVRVWICEYVPLFNTFFNPHWEIHPQRLI